MKTRGLSRDADVFGTQIAPLTLGESADAITGLASRGGGGYVCLCNLHLVMAARREPRLADALAGATFALADGTPVVWRLRRARPDAQRVAGPDLFEEVLINRGGCGLRHLLVGGSDSTLAALRSNLEQRAPGLEICGAIAPPFAGLDALSGSLIERIRELRPDVVWVSLGAPKQELWMARHSNDLAPALLVGVGAAFDFHAGTVPRAPQWMQRTGSEWLYRVFREPRRLSRRYLSTNTRYAGLLLIENVWRVGRRTVMATQSSRSTS